LALATEFILEQTEKRLSFFWEAERSSGSRTIPAGA